LGSPRLSSSSTHREGNHQGLDNQLFMHDATSANDNAIVKSSTACRERLGGLLLNFYYRPIAERQAPGSPAHFATAPAGAADEPCALRST